MCLALLDKIVFNKKGLVDKFYNEGKTKTSQDEIDAYFAMELADVGKRISTTDGKELPRLQSAKTSV